MEISKKAKEWAEESGLYEAEVYQTYIDNVGEEYATKEKVEEAYQGEYKDDEDFAQSLAEDLGYINKDVNWPYTCIDWEQAANELMYDYFESNGYYFRNL